MSAESTAGAQSVQRQFARFFVVGVGATLLHQAVYMGINAAFGINDQQQLALNVSYAAGYALSFVANYLVTTYWTFQTQTSAKKGAGFAFSHLVNYGLHTLLLNLFITLGLGKLLVTLNECILPAWLMESIPALGEAATLLPLPIYVIVVPLNFLLVRYFLTRKS